MKNLVMLLMALCLVLPTAVAQNSKAQQAGLQLKGSILNDTTDNSNDASAEFDYLYTVY